MIGLISSAKRMLFAAVIGAAAVLYLLATTKARKDERRQLNDHFTKKGYAAAQARALSDAVSNRNLRGELQRRGWLRD